MKNMPREGVAIHSIAAVSLFLCAYAALQWAQMRLTGAYAWDDGTITLAYARTLADKGLFALTGASDAVEGSSSLLTVFIVALLHKIVGFDFYGFIRASQILALASVLWMSVLVYRTFKRLLPRPGYRVLVLALFATLPMFTAEVLNGMEMAMFGLLLLCLSLAYERHSPRLFLLIPLLLLTRFEAVFHVCFALSCIFVLQKPQRRRAAMLLAYTLAVFLLLTVLRWLYFGDVFPNTVWAKMNPPYSAPGPWPVVLQTKLLGTLEFLKVNGPLLLGAVGLWWLREPGQRMPGFKEWLVLSFLVFALVTGVNWGYEGRMSLACLPLLLLMMKGNVSALALRTDPQRGARLALAIMAGCLVATHFVNLGLYAANVRAMARGAYQQNLLPDVLRAKVAQQMQRNKSIYANWHGVTPDNFKITGLAIDNIRAGLGQDTIKVVVPDVGGLALCCTRLDVLDSGLLTNGFLARKGYGQFDRFLAKELPEVIVTHTFWSEQSHIYQSKQFQAHYSPLMFEGHLFWLRRDSLQALLASPRIDKARVQDLQEVSRLRYGGVPVDMAYLNSLRLPFVWRMSLKSG